MRLAPTAVALTALALLLAAGTARAAPPDLDALARESGVAIETATAEDGAELRSVKLPSGVRFVERRMDGVREPPAGVDESGHGAVLCAWDVYITLSATAAICGGAEAGMQAELDEAIGKINGFVVANSLEPVTAGELAAAVKARREALRAQSWMQAPDEIERACQQGGAAALLREVAALPRDQFRRSVADLLSVPRPPVSLPCL